jgi:GNAT superfamily N-acetyltransferase
MALEIREMRPGDADEVAALAAALGYPANRSDIEERLAALTGRRDHAVLVASDGGRVVGWVHVYGSVWVQSPPFAEVGGIVVAEDRRGRGVGEELLGAAETWARDRGYREMRVRSRDTRAGAHGFYLRRGYEVEKTSLTFHKAL